MLSGAHIACGYVGGAGPYGQVVALLRKVSWSQTMGSPGTTAQLAPGVDAELGQPCFEVRFSADAYVAVGATPDAATGPRIFVPAGETRNLFADKGDKLAWVAA